MGQRSGTLLERDVSRLFKLVGFNPQNNVFIEDYEIDVFVQVESYNIVVECKQYERSSLSVRNLIHQWESKNKIIKASKVLLVLVGCNITQKDYQLAQQFGITIWNEEWLEHLMDLVSTDKEKAKFEVLSSLGINFFQPEVDSLTKMLLSFFEESENKLTKAENSEDSIFAVNYLVKEGTAKIIESLNILKNLKKQGLDVNTLNDFIDSFEKLTLSELITGHLCNSIFYSMKISIEDSANKERFSKEQIKEFKAFFKRINKYLKKHNGSGNIKSLEEYNYIKDEIVKLGTYGKLEGFNILLSNIEDAMGYDDLMKIIDEGYNEIEKTRREINT